MSENNYSYEYEPVAAEPAAPAVNPAGKILGIIGMVLGITSICMCWGYFCGFACAVPGIILSVISKKKGEVKFSKIGLLLSIIGTVLGFVSIVVYAVVIAIASGAF